MHFLVEIYDHLIPITFNVILTIVFLVDSIGITEGLRTLLDKDLEVAHLSEAVNLAEGHKDVLGSLHENQDQGHYQVKRTNNLVQNVSL